MEEKLQTLIDDADRVLVLSGAGVSTGSGIRDFRGKHGLYTEDYLGLPPEKILSQTFFETYTEEFYRYYFKYMAPDASFEPNSIHQTTKRLEEEGKLLGVITQNIDGLYKKAGITRPVIEIHGTGDQYICANCRRPAVRPELDKETTFMSDCCRAVVRPNIVLYDEFLDPIRFFKANQLYEEADLLIVMGTGLDIGVHFQCAQHFNGPKVFILNKPAPDDISWSLTYNEKIEDIFY